MSQSSEDLNKRVKKAIQANKKAQAKSRRRCKTYAGRTRKPGMWEKKVCFRVTGGQMGFVW